MKSVKIATGTYKQKGTTKELFLIYIGGSSCVVIRRLKTGRIQKRERKIVPVSNYLLKNDYYYADEGPMWEKLK